MSLKKEILRVVMLACAVLLLFSLVSCNRNRGSAQPGGKQSISLRIGSGHSLANPWVASMDNFFVPEVSKRVSERTNYEIEWVKAYGASVARLGDELEAIEEGLLDLGTIIIVFEPVKLMLHTMQYRMPFACSDPIVANKVSQQLYREFPEHVTEYEQHNQKLLAMGV